MIVTCPGCSSKYRVRNEAVPTDGARMRCPKCDTLFLAKPPAGGELQQANTVDDQSAPYQQLNPSTSSTGAPVPPSFGAGATPGFPQGAPGARPANVPGVPANVPAPFQPFQPQPAGGALFRPPQGAQPGSQQQPQQPAPFPSGAPPFSAQGPQSPFAPPQGVVPLPLPSQPPHQQPQPPAPPAAAAGPITSLFKAFDPASLPPGVQMPVQQIDQPHSVTQPPLRDLSGNAPSGLSLDDGKARAAFAPGLSASGTPMAASGMGAGSLGSSSAGPSSGSSSSSLRSAPTTSSTATQLGRPRGSSQPSTMQVVASWFALVVGLGVAACSLTFAAWTTEAANLDATLMPTFEQSFGRTPPRSTVKRGDASADELRSAATQAQADGDLPRAVVLWRRVQLREPTDPRAAQLIPKLLSDLGDQGAP